MTTADVQMNPTTRSAEPPGPEPILQLAMGFMASKHLFIANAVGLFEHLADGPLSLHELAARSGIPKRTVRILVDAMVALGLVEGEDDRYRNGTAAATYLTGRQPADLRPLLRFWDRISFPAWLQLEQVARSGERATRHGNFTEEEQRIFSEGVEALTAAPAHALPEVHDFSRCRAVLDIGGGTGSFVLELARKYPGLHSTLFELPTVAQVARRHLDDDERGRLVRVVAGDFFVDALPTDHDAVILANVVHLFSPERNRELLRRIRQVVPPRARLLLVDFWTDSTHAHPLPAALLAGEFLLIAGDGDVYSEREVRGWLTACGWQPLEYKPLAGATSVLVAEAI